MQPKYTAVQQTSPPSTATPANETYLVITEWNVRFKLSKDIEHLTYFKPLGSSTDGFSFTTSELKAKEPHCSGEGPFTTMPIGFLSRASAQQPGMGKVVAQIDGYYYQYRSTDAACSEGDTALEQKVMTAMNGAVTTIEANE